MTRWPKLTTLALTVAVLGGCETAGLPFMEKAVVLQCPDYFILEDAAAITEFRDGPGRDITDVVFKAQIAEMQLGCLTDIDKDTDSGKMVIDISPIVGAEMGPANTSETAKVPYFVIVTDPNKEILYREELSLNVSFRGNNTQIVILAPPTSVEIPITPTIRNNYYRIYSGFDLTREQVEYNRKLIRDRLQ